MVAAGRMNASPATTRPARPARRRPTSIASSVEFGPGMRLVTPTRSTSCCVGHPARRSTTSRRIRATCAAGPPKPMMPSVPKTTTSSASRGRLTHGGSVASRLPMPPRPSRPARVASAVSWADGDVLEELVEQLVLVAGLDGRAALAVDRHLDPMGAIDRHGAILSPLHQRDVNVGLKQVRGRPPRIGDRPGSVQQQAPPAQSQQPSQQPSFIRIVVLTSFRLV